MKKNRASGKFGSVTTTKQLIRLGNHVLTELHIYRTWLLVSNN
jgi:hypothetical protein